MDLVKRAKKRSNHAIEVKLASGDNAWGQYDGNWSLFDLKVGNNADGQNFRFPPSTTSFETWLPSAGGCNISILGNFPTVPSTVSQCPIQRGVGLFHGTQSAGYDRVKSPTYLNLLQDDLLSLGPDEQMKDVLGMDYRVVGAVGLDYLSMQYADGSSFSSNATVPVFDYEDWRFFLPSVGLGFGNWTTKTGWALSFMSNLANHFTIPSRTWGYTAGARYRDDESPGSLVLGGYDAARIDNSYPTGIFNITPDSSDLVVEIASISVDRNGYETVTYQNPVRALVDSSVPYMFLPDDLCQWFAVLYGLKYDGNPAEGYSGLWTLNANQTSTYDLFTQNIALALRQQGNKMSRPPSISDSRPSMLWQAGPRGSPMNSLSS